MVVSSAFELSKRSPKTGVRTSVGGIEPWLEGNLGGCLRNNLVELVLEVPVGEGPSRDQRLHPQGAEPTTPAFDTFLL
jgi:hypothetical protein